jgi:AbrB family looped-hinge helix DNA binding protein
MTTITKATSRGQITLPKPWRDKFKTSQYLVKTSNDKIEIFPVNKKDLEEDMQLGMLAQERDTGDASYVSHDDAWK